MEILEAYLEEHTADASAVTDIGAVREYEEMRMEQSTEHTRAYIKIQDGCNQFCSYCIIPFVRGRVRSRKQEDVLAEVRGLAEKGFQEVVITGIHLSSYGMDFIGETDGDYLKNGKDLRGTAFERAYLVSFAGGNRKGGRHSQNPSGFAGAPYNHRRVCRTAGGDSAALSAFSPVSAEWLQ